MTGLLESPAALGYLGCCVVGVSVVRGTEGPDRVGPIGLKDLEKEDEVLILGPLVFFFLFSLDASLFSCPVQSCGNLSNAKKVGSFS